MELEVNERGNLFVPSSRLLAMAQSCFISVPFFYGVAWIQGDGVLELFPSPARVLAFLAVSAVVAHLLLRLQAVIEFDNARRQLRKGRTIIANYDQIRQIELRRDDSDELLYTIVLRLGVARTYEVLQTQNETSASLDAASIARAVGKLVEVVG